MPSGSGQVSPVDSLDGDNEERDQQTGKINIINSTLLSQLTSNSPLPVYKPAPSYRTTPNYSAQVKIDMEDYQYVNPNIDDDLNLSLTPQPPDIQLPDEWRTPVINIDTQRAPADPVQSQSPQQSAHLRPTLSQSEVPQRSSSNGGFVPKLALTDSLVADDPDPDAARVVHDSLDSSMDEEDFQRLENLMNSKQPLPNPFQPDKPTPNTLNELSISLALVESATPRPIYSQSDFQMSVMSSYADDAPTPRVDQQPQQAVKSALNHMQPITETHSYTTVQQQFLHQQSQHQATSQMQQLHQPVRLIQQAPQGHPIHQQLQANTVMALPQNTPAYYQGVAQPQMSSQHQAPGYPAEKNYHVSNQNIPEQFMGPPQLNQHYTTQKPQHYQHTQQSFGAIPTPYMTEQIAVTPQQYMSQQGYQDVQQQSYQNTYQQHLHHVQQTMSQAQTTQRSYLPANSGSPQSSPKGSPKSSPRHTRYQTPVVGTVAPKPSQPAKDFIERNKDRARGVSSAKGGYASRMMQAKQKQEELKNWAPGMVLPRKKAASADNAMRNNKASQINTERHAFADGHRETSEAPAVRTVWEQRANQLAQIKSSPKKVTPRREKSPDKTPQTTITDRESITESRVKMDLNLDIAAGFVQTDPRMKLIGPIPQQPQAGNIRQMSPRSYAPPVMMGVHQHDPHVGSVPRYHSPTGPVEEQHLHVQQVHPINERIHISGPVQHPSHYSSHHPGNSYHSQQSVERPPQMYSQTSVQSQANQSYSQYYHHQSGYGDTMSEHAGSRWNQHQKPPNFIPSESDMTLDDVIALEEQKLGIKPMRKSTDSLNPYQAVPPISHSLEEPEEGEEENEGTADQAEDGGGGYSQIHKSQKEKEGKGANYKKYTLKDYKKLNTEVKLGGLGPSGDPEKLKEKHERRQKQMQLAKEARELESKRAQSKTKTSEGRREQKTVQPSGRQLAQEYAKNIPKPKVVPKSKNPTPAPTANLPSARSLSKLNDISTDRQQQLTYRAADKPQSNANYTNHQTVGFPLQSAGISHSFSSPILSQLAGGYGDAPPGAELPDQFGYVDAIEALHKRHLEEKRMVASVRNKI